MTVRVVPEPPSALSEYARVSIAFEAREAMDVARSADGDGFVLTRRQLSSPIFKDYDALPFDGPVSWPSRFDLSSWAFFGAYSEGTRVGGAAVILRSTEIELLEGRDDMALLWDLRVAPAVRRRGVGSALLNAVESRVRGRGAAELKVETQDVNVPACRFYARQGFRLRTVHAHAYPELPHETQLLWHKELVASVSELANDR